MPIIDQFSKISSCDTIFLIGFESTFDKYFDLEGREKLNLSSLNFSQDHILFK